MAKRSLDNKKDIDTANNVAEGNSRGFIKLGTRTYIRIRDKGFESEFVHYLGKRPIICLGDYEKDKGYSPEKCPVCEKKEKQWEKYNLVKDKKTKEAKIKKDEILKEINKVESTLIHLLVANKGNIKTDEDETGELKTFVEWEKEAKILKVSKAQWTKLTIAIFEKYDFMKTVDDLINRNLIFKKENKKGNDESDYTEVEIVPSKKKSKASMIENDLPNLADYFVKLSKKEMIKLLKEFSEDEDFEDDDLEEEDAEEETKTGKKNLSKKATKKSKKKEETEEEPDFVKDDSKDDDFENDDDDDDDFEDFEDDDEL
ncbi:hypothetical protein KAH94_00810 [bacterium]|nr:hypothetical protein [bacterium]